MSDISLSKAVRSNLLSLQNTASMMATTQERLATGNKVNSALDNPTNFFTASSLNSRASDMNALMDGMSNGIQTLEAADNGLSAITKTLESMQSTLRQARQDKSFQTKSFEVNDNTVLDLSGGAGLDISGLSLPALTSGAKATVSGGAAYAGPTVADADDAAGAGAGARSVITFQASMVGGAGDKIKVDGTEVDLSTAGDIDDVVSAISSAVGTTDYSVTKNDDGTKIIIENKAVTGTSSTSPVVDLGSTASTYGSTSFTYSAAAMGAGTTIKVDGTDYTVGGTIESFAANLQDALGTDNYTVSADTSTNKISVTSKTAGGAAPVIGVATGASQTYSIDAASLGATAFGVALTGSEADASDLSDTLNADAGFSANYTASVDSDSGKLRITTKVTGAAANFAIDTGVSGQASGSGITGISDTQAGVDAVVVGAKSASKTFAIDTATLGATVFGVTLGGSEASAQDVADTLNADDTFGADYTATVDTDGNLVVTTNDASAAANASADLAGATLVKTTAATAAVAETATAGQLGASVTTVAAAQDKFTVTYGNKSVDVAVGSDGSATQDEIAESINSQLSAAGLDGVKASFDASGKLSIGAVNAESKALSITGSGASAVFGATADMSDVGEPSTNATNAVDRFVEIINRDYSGSLRASNDDGKLRVENLSTQDLDVSVDKDGTGASTLSTIDGNSTRDDLAAQFNDLRDQLDKLADDASFNGINLLRGDKLTLTFNETGTSSIDIQAEDKDGNTTSINSLNLGIASLDGSDLDSDNNIDDLLSGLSSALGSIRSLSSTFGSNLSSVQNRQDFTKNMVNTLQTGAANLTLADTNEEAANLLALQTRQQLSSTALSMASQSDQAVLRLF